MHKTLTILLIAAVLGMAGCKSKPVKTDTASQTGTEQSGAETSGADANGAGVGDTGEGSEVPGPQEGILAKRIIYFDFDSSEIRGEDTEFGRRVLNGGERLYYEPAAVVHHPVASERLTRSYFLKWWFDKGRSDTLECPQHDSYAVAGIPVSLFKRFAGDTLRWTVTLESSRRFDYKRQVWGIAGEITERYRLAAGKQKIGVACKL